MRAFGHAFQPQVILALAKFFASNLLFSHKDFDVRTSAIAMNPHTFRARHKA